MASATACLTACAASERREASVCMQKSHATLIWSSDEGSIILHGPKAWCMVSCTTSVSQSECRKSGQPQRGIKGWMQCLDYVSDGEIYSGAELTSWTLQWDLTLFLHLNWYIAEWCLFLEAMWNEISNIWKFYVILSCSTWNEQKKLSYMSLKQTMI